MKSLVFVLILVSAGVVSFVAGGFALGQIPKAVPEIAAEKKLEIRTLEYRISKQLADLNSMAAQIEFLRRQAAELGLQYQQHQAAILATQAELAKALEPVQREGWEFDAESLSYREKPGPARAPPPEQKK